MEERALQPKKAPLPIVFRLFPKVISVRFIHSWKQQFPIDSKLLGIVNDFNPLQEINAELDIAPVPSSSIILVLSGIVPLYL